MAATGPLGPLKSCRFVCAPMVRGSERAFRALVARYGVEAAYSPMIRASQLVEAFDRDGNLENLPFVDNIAGLDVEADEAIPCVVQLAGRDPKEMARAGTLVQRYFPWASGIDVNMGCPQKCAQVEGFGAFLLDDEELCESIVRELVQATTLPVTCKIRVLPGGVADTQRLAQRLERAGCSLLAVHGRTRVVKHDGPVDTEIIRGVVNCVTVPVYANGGVDSLASAEALIKDTGAAGVLIASGLLSNPRLLMQPAPVDLRGAVLLAMEYLRYAAEHPPPRPHLLYLQVHLRHILRKFLEDDIRWWSVLHRPWMKSPFQFMCFLQLLTEDRGLEPLATPEFGILADLPRLASFKDLRREHQLKPVDP